MSSRDYPDWQQRALWTGGELAGNAADALGVGTRTLGPFVLASWASLVVAIRATAGAATVTVTQHPQEGASNLAYTTTFTVAVGSDIFQPVPLLADSATVTLSSTNAATILDYSLYPSNVTVRSSVAGLPAAALPKRITALTSPGAGTFNALAGATALVVECWGGGAGGAGCAASGATTNCNVGAGGGAGGYSRALVLANIGAHAYTVGVGGSAGGGATIPGGNGSGSVFRDSANVIVCEAFAGVGTISSTGGGTVGAFAGGGASGGGSSLGALTELGGGGYGFRLSGSAGFTIGGVAPFPGRAVYQSVNGAAGGANGNIGAGPGGGGSGGVDTNNTQRNGGAGGPGMIVVTEHG